MKSKIKQFFQKPTHLIAFLLALAVVGVGAAMAITALASDAHYHFKSVAHFYLDDDSYRDLDSSSQVKVQFWRIQTQSETVYQDDAATYDGSSFQPSAPDDDDKQRAVWYGTITPNTPLSDAYKAKKVYIYHNKGGYDSEWNWCTVYYCKGTTTIGALLDACVEEGSTITSSLNSDGVYSLTLDTQEADDLSGDDKFNNYYDSNSYYLYIADEKPYPSYWEENDSKDLNSFYDYSPISFYYNEDPARTYTATYTSYDYLDEDAYVKLDGEDPYSEVTLVKSTTGKFWFSQSAVTLPIPKEAYGAYSTYVRVLVDGEEREYQSAYMDTTLTNWNGTCFASKTYSTVDVFAVSDTFEPFGSDGYSKYCYPLAVRIKYDYATAHGTFAYNKNEKTPQVNNQAAIEEYYENDSDGDNACISTYNWNGINADMDNLSDFFGRGVYLAGDASDQNGEDNKAPQYSNDDVDYVPVMGWLLEENRSKKWGLGYNTDDTGDDQVWITVGELFYSLTNPDDEFDAYDDTKAETAWQNAADCFVYNNQSGFYEYTFLVEPDIPVVEYKAIYLDKDGNPLKDNGVVRTVNLSAAKYGDTYKIKSYGAGDAVTVGDKLDNADFPGYTFSGWELDETSFPDGKTVNDVAGRVYEPKKDEHGDVIEGQYTDNVTSFAMPAFGVVLKGTLSPTVYTLTYDTNKDGFHLSVTPSVPQNVDKENAATQQFTIADCMLYENQPVYGNPDDPSEVTDTEDYYLYTFPTRTTTAKDAGGSDLYFLKGWGKASDSTTTVTTVKITDLETTEYTVYAVWENTVTYQPGRANNTDVSGEDVVDKTVTNGEHTMRAACPFAAPTGFHFKGWQLVSPTGKDYPAKFETQEGETTIAEGSQITVKDNVTYKAMWEGDKHKVTYALTGSDQPSVTLPAEAEVAYTDNYTVADKLTETGYTFSGWDVKAGDVPDADITKDGNGNAASFKMPNNNVTVQGTFTVNKHNVTYTVTGDVPAGFDVAALNQANVAYGTSVTVAAQPGYTGYTFTGWTTEDVTVSGGQFTMPDKDVNLTGTFAINTHNVTYSVNGDIPAGYTAPAQQTGVAYGTQVTVAEKPSYTGYTFTGWTTTDATVTDGKFAMPDNNVTLTGTFTVNKHNVTYTVTGDVPAGFDVTTLNKTNVAYGTQVTVEAQPAYEGYTFTGWTTADVTVSGGKFNMPDKNVTLTGSFSIHTHNVTYTVTGDVPDGYTAPDGQTGVTYGTQVTVAEKPAFEGYTFTGWTTADATVTDGKFAMPDKNVTLTGTFAINKHNVTYTVTGDIPAGYTAPDGQTGVAYGTQVTVAEKPAFEGYTFTGWTTADATVTDGKFAMPDKDVTLTGSFAVNTHKVTYSVTGNIPAGYTAPAEQTSVAYGTQVTVAEKPEYEGYTFTGWTTTDATVSGGKFAMPDKNVTLRGTFTTNTNDVIYEVDGDVPDGYSTASLTRTDVAYGTEVTVAEKPAFEGYTFTGWTTDDVTVSGGKFAMPDKTVTLRGTFAINKHNVTYSVTGEVPAGYTAPAQQTGVAYGTQVTVANQPAVEGYTFTGWTTTDATVSGGKFAMPDKDVTLTGTFAKKQYTVTYQPNVPESTLSDKVFEGIAYGSSHTVWDNTGDGAFAYFGHTFGGWELVSPASGYATSGSIEVKDNVTYRAIWNTDLYTLQYDKGIVSELSASSPALPATNDTITLAELRANNVTVSTTKLQADGYTFKGWKITNTDDDTKTRTYDADQFDAAEFDGTVYEALFDSARTATAVAMWEAVEPVHPTYTVHYRYQGTAPDGASAVPDDVTGKEPGDLITVADLPTVPDGYSFKGWFFEDSELVSDFEGTDTHVTSFTMPAGDVTLVGKFLEDVTPPQPTTYTLKYDCNTSTYSDLTGLSHQPADEVLTEDDFTDDKYTLTTDYPESDNFRFVCWSKTPTYSFANRVSEVVLSDFGSDATCTVYAIWIAKLDVTYTCGISEDDPAWENNQIDTTHLFEIDQYTLNYRVRSNEELEHPFVYPGYEITKWKVMEGWENIEFPSQPSGGSIGTAAAPAYRRSGNGDEEHFLQFNTLVILHGNVTVEAVWEPISSGTELTVTYNANGGTGAVPVDSNKYNTNDTPTVLPKGDSLVKEGAEFVEWNTQANGNGKGYQAGQQLDPMTADVTLYAIWKPSVNYIVEYDGNGHTAGTVPTDNSRYAAGSTAEVKSKGDLEKTGCTFKEWNTQPNGSGTGYKGDGTDTITVNGNVKLYAIWLDPNGNIVSPGTGESNLPMLMACNMALLSMLAGGLVLIRRKKAETQQTAQ